MQDAIRRNHLATAVASDELTSDQARLLLGRSLEDSTGTGDAMVKALVGLPEVTAAGAWGAAGREIRLYRWLLGMMLLVGTAVTVGRRRFG